MSKAVQDAQSVLVRYCISAKLRALRVRRHLTLARLSAETGLSTALLSKLETDRMIPTLATLATICRVHGVGLEHFFGTADRHTLSITRREHLLGNSRASGMAAKIPLNAPTEAPRLIPEVIEIAAGAMYSPEEPTGQMCAFVYVLEGTLEINTGGVIDTLTVGDCAYFDSKLPVSWTTKAPNCKVLVVRPGGGVRE